MWAEFVLLCHLVSLSSTKVLIDLRDGAVFCGYGLLFDVSARKDV
jgi:hypothetical protein